MLALRSNIDVELGKPAPPWLLDAVPAGNVALERIGGAIHLVMGGTHGASYQTRVRLSANGQADVRALALALEALSDRMIDRRAQLAAKVEAKPASPPPPAASEPALEPEAMQLASVLVLAPPEPQATLAVAFEPETAVPLQPVTVVPETAVQETAVQESVVPAAAPEMAAQAPLTAADTAVAQPAPPPRDDGAVFPVPERADRSLRVEPLVYLAAYGGASAESATLRTGVSAGGGLCVRGQCVLLAIEYPLPINMEAGGNDVRYRYPTFSCNFYSRPIRFGPFTPGVGVGLLTRVGHFERDMGLTDSKSGLDTDLALRGTLEGAFAILNALDLVVEAGADYALDRWEAGRGSDAMARGARTAPWLQAGIRIRPY